MSYDNPNVSYDRGRFVYDTPPLQIAHNDSYALFGNTRNYFLECEALKRVRSQHIDGFCGAPEVPLDPKTNL